MKRKVFFHRRYFLWCGWSTGLEGVWVSPIDDGQGATIPPSNGVTCRTFVIGSAGRLWEGYLVASLAFGLGERLGDHLHIQRPDFSCVEGCGNGRGPGRQKRSLTGVVRVIVVKLEDSGRA
jgi:hypothetical protein